MTDCKTNLFGKKKCEFEPRYDLSAPDFSGFSSIKNMYVEVLEALKKKTYVRDVCVSCGKTIERNQ